MCFLSKLYILPFFWILQRQDYAEISEEDLQDTEEEKPQVVVLKPGDLTAEEVAQVEERLRKGKNNT